MSHEASSSSAAVSNHSRDDGAAERSPPSAAEVAKKRKKNREMFNKKRGELLDDLLRSLDVLIYAELSAIYYMEYAACTLHTSSCAHAILAAPSFASSSEL